MGPGLSAGWQVMKMGGNQATAVLIPFCGSMESGEFLTLMWANDALVLAMQAGSNMRDFTPSTKIRKTTIITEQSNSNAT